MRVGKLKLYQSFRKKIVVKGLGTGDRKINSRKILLKFLIYFAYLHQNLELEAEK
jgi:hypothetical protein